MPTKLQRERARGIGGSDAPVVCGVARWLTPLQLWAKKVAALEGKFGDEEEDNDLILWGKLMEPQILKQFGARTGRDIIRPRNMFRHDGVDWMIAHLDGRQQDQDLGLGSLEAKNVSRYVRDRWIDEPPIEVQVQLQHCLAVTGDDYGTAVGLIGGHQLVWLDIERNQKFIDALMEKEHQFWMRVLADNPPTATAADHKFLNTLVKAEPSTTISLGGVGLEVDMELQEVLNEIEKQKEVLAPLEEKKKELEARIKQMMGNAVEAQAPNGQVYTFNEVVVSPSKGYTYRRLVRKK